MKTLLEKIGFSPTRIKLQGNENICKWYLPTVKSVVKDFIGRCEDRGLKQGAHTLTFHNPHTSVRIIYHYGAVEVLINAEPLEKPKPPPKPELFPKNLLVLCGDEDIGYNVAVFAEGGANAYYRFNTMIEVMATFPVAEHKQAQSHRYSYVADTALGVATEGEPITEGYVRGAVKGGQYDVHAVPHTTPLIAGVRCLPPNFELQAPHNSAVFETLVQATRCNALDEDQKAVLEQFDHFGISTEWEMQYTPRMFILAQNPGQSTTRMFDKRDVVLCVDGASSITGINTHAWVNSGQFSIESIKNKSLYAISAARHADYDCSTNPFFSTNAALFYGQYMGLFVMQKAESPAGPLLILNDDNLVARIWQLTDSFFAFTEDYLGCEEPERFIPTFDNAFFAEIDAANTAYKSASLSDEESRKYYSFTFPNILFSGVTHRAPMTETIDAYRRLPVTGMFTEVIGTNGHRPNMTCAKNITSSILYRGQRLDIYFSTFLEATYTYSTVTTFWSPVESQQVFMGAAKKQAGNQMVEYGVLKNLKDAFTQFRVLDLEATRVPALGPHPCAGAAMFYPFQKGQNYFADELDCFNKINEYRVTMGAPKLKWDGTLNTPAATHADDMILYGAGGGHQGSDYGQSWHRIMASGVTGWCKQISTYGEIIAINCDTAEEAVDTWKLSVAGHHEALYTKRHIACGIAVRNSEATGKMWVVTFAGEQTLDTIP